MNEDQYESARALMRFVRLKKLTELEILQICYYLKSRAVFLDFFPIYTYLTLRNQKMHQTEDLKLVSI